MSFRIDITELKPTDVIILRGEWEMRHVCSLVRKLGDMGLDNLIIGLPPEQDLETMELSEFYKLVKEVERRVQGCSSVGRTQDFDS